MKQYGHDLIARAVECRMKGDSYLEINRKLRINVPKSTYTYWFRKIVIPERIKERLRQDAKNKLDRARVRAVASNKIIRANFLKSLDSKNEHISRQIINPDVAKIALAMLCLGEASKSTSTAGFYLGSANQKIIKLFIELLRLCFKVDETKFRFTIQCRADQDVYSLEKYWRKVVDVSGARFYNPRIDERTAGKPTKNAGYKGVLRVDYIDKKVQLELESLADLIYNQIVSKS